MSYQIIPLSAGEVSHCRRSELSRNLRPNTLLAVLNRAGVVTHSYPITAHTLVSLAVDIAEYALDNCGEEHPASRHAINFARMSLRDPDSVSLYDMRTEGELAEQYADEALQSAEDEQEELDRECENGGGDFTAFGYDEYDLNGAYAAAAAVRAAACLSEGNTSGMDEDVLTAFRRASESECGRHSSEREFERQGRYICAYLKRTYAGGVTA